MNSLRNGEKEMFPYYGQQIEKDKIVTEMKMIDVDAKLILDRKKCTGCGICITVCPKEAIQRGPVGAAEKELSDVPAVLVDKKKCSFCGICVHLCPFEALELLINDEPKLIVVEGGALPNLKAEKVKLAKDEGKTAKKYFEGEIIAHPQKCPGGCATCVLICPTEAIKIPKREHPWDKPPKIEVDKDKCILCGLCVAACPGEGALEIRRTKVLSEGEHTEIWDKIVEKLTTPKTS
ncbi:MAG: 4Fe-4S binding protein [Candidatus Freyarchaeota archaeon]